MNLRVFVFQVQQRSGRICVSCLMPKANCEHSTCLHIVVPQLNRLLAYEIKLLVPCLSLQMYVVAHLRGFITRDTLSFDAQWFMCMVYFLYLLRMFVILLIAFLPASISAAFKIWALKVTNVSSKLESPSLHVIQFLFEVHRSLYRLSLHVVVLKW